MRHKPGQTLGATALVHEAYLRLVETPRGGQDEPSPRQWGSRRHFFAAAAEAMRRILVDRARRKRSRKRGGDRQRVPFEEVAAATEENAEDVLSVDDALVGLAAADPQAAELVKLRYFVGMTIPEASEALGISPRSADRLWAYARAWLRRAIDGP